MYPDFITMAPTSGDGAHPVGSSSQPAGGWTAANEREPSLEYLTNIARVTEEAGFSTLLLPVGTGCLDGWITAAALATRTDSLRYLVAVRPGFVQPAVAARQVSTLDYLTGGRVSVNVVTGGSPAEQARDGDFLDHEARYRRTFEFVDILKRLFLEEAVDHEGEFYRIEDASLSPRTVQQPRPPFFIAGASPPGMQLSAEEAEVYMMWGDRLEDAARRIVEVRELADTVGRELSCSISFQVILGETEEEAWGHALAILRDIDPEAASRQEAAYGSADSVGQRRLASLMKESGESEFRLGPNLWAGLTQVLSGNSIALVGTPDQVADRIAEYVARGFDRILLRGFPHLEMIEQIGREVIPRVRKRVEKEVSA